MTATGYILRDGTIEETDGLHLGGMAHGYGVFETLRAYGGRLFQFAAHIERMRAGTARLKLDGPPPGKDLERGCAAVLETVGLADARMRITCVATAGGSRLWTERGLLPATTVIQAEPVDPSLARLRGKGVAVIRSTHRVTERSIVTGVKTIGYAGHILAKSEAVASGAWEAIILNSRGDIVEGSMSNVFLVWDDQVFTPPLDSGPLAGVTRQTVIELAREAKMECNEVRFGIDAVKVADECFLTSSVAEIVPVTSLDGEPIGDGRVGEITCRLQQAYARLVAAG